MPTTVVTVRGRPRAALLADTDFVYCGRACAGWPRSLWGNPFTVREHGEDALALFKLGLHLATTTPHLLATSQLVGQWEPAFRAMAANLADLRGKVLGCWCGSWQPGEPEIPCHAVVLALAANGLRREGQP